MTKKAQRIIENLFDYMLETQFKEQALKELRQDLANHNIWLDKENLTITIQNHNGTKDLYNLTLTKK